LKEGQEGFKITSEKIENLSIKSQFLDFSEQRAKFIHQLDPYSSETTTSVEGIAVKAVGAIHRGWIDVKSALGGGDTAILNEAERGRNKVKARIAILYFTNFFIPHKVFYLSDFLTRKRHSK